MTVANPSMPGVPLETGARRVRFPLYGPGTLESADAGTDVAPGDQQTVGASRRSWRWQFLTDFDSRPEGAEEHLQRRQEGFCVPSGSYLRDAVHSEPVPVEGRCGVARIEVAHHSIQAREGRGVVDPRPGPLPDAGIPSTATVNRTAMSSRLIQGPGNAER